jgi:S1-C subfamily serine protease
MGRGGIGPSDHMSFALKKIPVLFLFSGMHADYHRPTDKPDKINYGGLDLVVDFTGELVDGMARMEKQQYVDAADASPMRVGLGQGSGGGGSRVTLGVVPDYSSFGEGGGVRISGTRPDTPAAAAGLKAGDIIVRLGDRNIDTLQDLSDALAKAKPGQTVKLRILRDGGKTPLELEATLAARK